MGNKSTAQARTVGMYEEDPCTETLPHEPDPVVADIAAVLDGFHEEQRAPRKPRQKRTVAERLDAMREQWRRTRDGLLKQRTNLRDQIHHLQLRESDLSKQIEECTRAMGEPGSMEE